MCLRALFLFCYPSPRHTHERRVRQWAMLASCEAFCCCICVCVCLSPFLLALLLRWRFCFSSRALRPCCAGRGKRRRRGERTRGDTRTAACLPSGRDPLAPSLLFHLCSRCLLRLCAGVDDGHGEETGLVCVCVCLYVCGWGRGGKDGAAGGVAHQRDSVTRSYSAILLLFFVCCCAASSLVLCACVSASALAHLPDLSDTGQNSIPFPLS